MLKDYDVEIGKIEVKQVSFMKGQPPKYEV